MFFLLNYIFSTIFVYAKVLLVTMYFKPIILKQICFLLLLIQVSAFGQIKVSEKIQLSKIAQTTDNKLYFLDFWATWCGPCVFAKEYLGVLQKQFPKDFYVISISEENPELIKRHLKKKSTDLAVFSDYNGNTLKHYNVQYLPYGVLVDATGKTLWEGSPTDFKTSDLQHYLKRTSKKASINEVFKEVSYSSVKEKINEYIPTNEIEIKETGQKYSGEALDVSKRKDYIKLTGNLTSILGYILKVHESQIIIGGNDLSVYDVFLNQNILNDKPKHTLKSLGLSFETTLEEKEVLVLDFKEAQLWDSSQISWGEDAANYLIGDADIQADNVLLDDMLYTLSHAMELPIKQVNTKESYKSKLSDWQIHYRFFSLMQQDLLDNFGIKANKKKENIEVYRIKKTPK